MSVATLESIFSIAQCFIKSQAEQSNSTPTYSDLFQHSLAECLNLFLYGTYDVALIEPTGANTVFALIVVTGLQHFNNQLHLLAEKIMNQRSSGTVLALIESDQARLGQAFTAFAADTSQIVSLFNHSNQRDCRKKFQKSLISWLEKVRGIVAIR